MAGDFTDNSISQPSLVVMGSSGNDHYKSQLTSLNKPTPSSESHVAYAIRYRNSK